MFVTCRTIGGSGQEENEPRLLCIGIIVIYEFLIITFLSVITDHASKILCKYFIAKKKLYASLLQACGEKNHFI